MRILRGLFIAAVMLLLAISVCGATSEQNLAQGKPASQSSTYQDVTAARANDGNTDGSHYHGSVSHTDNNPQAWWEVDLGTVYQIGRVVVWNRTDCCQERLNDFWVLVSNRPFTDNSAVVWRHRVPGKAERTTTVAVNQLGRYVRVQLTGQNYLSLAEVQVFGAMPAATPLSAAPGPVSSSGDKLSVSLSTNKTTIAVREKFQLTATVSGGAPPYSYLWQGKFPTERNSVRFQEFSPGEKTFTVKVTDAKGQVVSARLIIKVQEAAAAATPPAPSKTPKPAPDTAASPGKANVSVMHSKPSTGTPSQTPAAPAQAKTPPGASPVLPVPKPATPPPRKVVLGPSVVKAISDPCGFVNLVDDDKTGGSSGGPAPSSKAPAGLASTLAQNVNQLSRTQYAGAVTAAVEGSRMVLGPMSPEQERRFQKAWAPLYRFTSKRVLEYLDKLNPLLAEFLALRQAIEMGMLHFQQLRYEAEMAALWSNKQAETAAFEKMALLMQGLRNSRDRMRKLADEIKALGDPPDPLAELCRGQRAFKAALAAINPKRGAWVLKKSWSEITHQRKHASIKTNQLAFRGNAAQSLTIVPAEFMKYNGRANPPMIGQWLFRWSPLPSTLAPGDRIKVAGMVKSLQCVYQENARLFVYLRSPHHLTDHVYFNGMNRKFKPEYKFNGKFHTMVVETMQAGGTRRPLPKDDPAQNPRAYKGAVLPEFKEMVFTDRFHKMYWPKVKGGEAGWTFTLEVQVVAGYIRGSQYYLYEYDPNAPTPPAMPDPASFKTLMAAAGKKAAPEKGPDPDKAAKEKIAFHKQQIAFLRGDIERYHAMLQAAKDPKSKFAIERIIIGKAADLQGQLDAIETIRTGNYTRTRTAWDEIVAGQMRASSREMAAKLVKPIVKVDQLERVVRVFPMKDQAYARTQARERLAAAGDDPQKVKEVYRSLLKEAKGFNEDQLKEAKEAEADAQLVIDVLGYAQYAGHLTMYMTPFVAGGSTLALAYGLSMGSISGYQTGGLLGEDYKGVTGATAGAMVTAAGYMCQWVDYGLSFYIGATTPGKDGKPGGVWGGVKAAGRTFAERQVMKYATLGIQGGLARIRQGRTRMFQQRRDAGGRLVQKHQEAYQTLQRLKRSGADARTRQMAMNDLMDLTSAINATPHAKGFLKFSATPDQRRAYAATSRLHTQRVVRDLRAELTAQGVDLTGVRFQPIRNSGNTSPGMDLDLAVHTGGRRTIRMEYPPGSGRYRDVDLYRANQIIQTTFDRVYARNSGGRSAQRSWASITTTAHLEAYRDRSWLGIRDMVQNGQNPFAQIDPRYAADAARVTTHKTDVVRGPEYRAPRDDKVWEMCRGTGKDIKTKVLPLLKYRIRHARTPKEAAALKKHFDFYIKLTKAFNKANHDPVAAERAISDLTKMDTYDAVSMTSAAIEAMGKWSGTGVQD